jgi:AAA domain-containing protein
MSNPWAAWLGHYDTDRFVLSRKQRWDKFVNTAPRPEFDTLFRAQMAALSPRELDDYNQARKVWNANLPTVKTLQVKAAFGIINQVMASNHRDGDKLRGSVVIDAKPGLGKTTTAAQYGKEFHREQYRRYGAETPDGHRRLPVMFLSLSSGITLKGLNQKMLEFYGHPAASRTSRTQLGSLAVDCVLGCATRVIVIDDLHFIDFTHRNGPGGVQPPQMARQRDASHVHLRRRRLGTEEVFQRGPVWRGRGVCTDRSPCDPMSARTFQH